MSSETGKSIRRREVKLGAGELQINVNSDEITREENFLRHRKKRDSYTSRPPDIKHGRT